MTISTMLLVLFLGCSNVEDGDSKADVLTKDFFPMGPERYYTKRIYKPKHYGEKLSPLTFVSEEWSSKWFKSMDRVGIDLCVAFKKGMQQKDRPGLGFSNVKYRKTEEGIFRCDSFGGKKPLNFEVLQFKWGAKPGEKWITEVPSKNCLFSAQFDKMESLGGISCAVVTITRIDGGDYQSRVRYWLAKDIGIVRHVDFGYSNDAWRPGVEQIYSELKDIPPLDWE